MNAKQWNGLKNGHLEATRARPEASTADTPPGLSALPEPVHRAPQTARMDTAKPKLSAHILRELAVTAEADPRTVLKLVSGERVSPLVRRRILRALRIHGLSVLGGADAGGAS